MLEVSSCFTLGLFVGWVATLCSDPLRGEGLLGDLVAGLLGAGLAGLLQEWAGLSAEDASSGATALWVCSCIAGAVGLVAAARALRALLLGSAQRSPQHHEEHSLQRRLS